jgi:hypothetical protein
MPLRDVRFALDGDDSPWSLRESLERGVWPPLREADGSYSLRRVLRRFAAPGRALRELAVESRNVWRHVSRDDVVRELRHRLRDPAVMRQTPTDLCGPYSLLFELARRDPVLFVRGAHELLRDGVLTTRSGRIFEAAEDLRARPVPAGETTGSLHPAVEWIYAATMRDSENVIDDVDEGQGEGLELLEGTTWPFEIEEWIEDMLGLDAEYLPCWFGGELAAIRAGQSAVERGGVAILLVDKNLLKDGAEDGEPDSEENVWFLRARHHPGGRVDPFSGLIHSKDDDIPPDHYVVLLGNLRGAREGATDFRADVWSFGCEYILTGEPEGLGEYLYAVITGVP